MAALRVGTAEETASTSMTTTGLPRESTPSWYLQHTVGDLLGSRSGKQAVWQSCSTLYISRLGVLRATQGAQKNLQHATGQWD